MKKALKYMLGIIIAGFVLGIVATLFEMWSNMSMKLDNTAGEFNGILGMVKGNQLGYPEWEGTFHNKTDDTFLTLIDNKTYYLLSFNNASDLSALSTSSDSTTSIAEINGKTIYWNPSTTYHISGQKKRYQGYYSLGQTDSQGRELYDKDTTTDYYMIVVNKVQP